MSRTALLALVLLIVLGLLLGPVLLVIALPALLVAGFVAAVPPGFNATAVSFLTGRIALPADIVLRLPRISRSPIHAAPPADGFLWPQPPHSVSAASKRPSIASTPKQVEASGLGLL